MLPKLEFLPDPMKDRKCKEVPLPIFKKVPAEYIYGTTVTTEGSNISWPNLKSVFEREGRLEKSACVRILKEATELLTSEPNILAIKEPVCVVGDLHGQFYDLLKVLEIGGKPTDIQ